MNKCIRCAIRFMVDFFLTRFSKLFVDGASRNTLRIYFTITTMCTTNEQLDREELCNIKIFQNAYGDNPTNGGNNVSLVDIRLSSRPTAVITGSATDTFYGLRTIAVAGINDETFRISIINQVTAGRITNQVAHSARKQLNSE